MKTILAASWADISAAAATLTKLIANDPRVTDESVVLPVIRGGLVPGAMVAYALQLTLCQPIHAVAGKWSSARDDLIVIDDICDTGQSFKNIRTRFPNAIYAATYVKPRGFSLCHYHGQIVDQDDWVVMPWAPNDEINR